MNRPALALVLHASLLCAQIPAPTDAPKPLSPEASAAAFKLPAGSRMEVVASEPLIASPSGVCWDERGRMFVSELHGYNLAGQLDIAELNKTGKLDTQVRRVQADEKFKRAATAGTYGVVKLLLDTDYDGRMDKVEVWATNLPPAYGLVPARGGVIVACAPHIVFLSESGKQQILFTGFRTGELERGINAPQWGIDGWIYFGRGWGAGKITGPSLASPVELPSSDFRIRADGSAIEPVTGATHTFGFAMTESGDRFVVTTTTPGIFIAPLPWRYLLRNPDAATPKVESPTGDRRAYAISQPHPWRRKRAEDPAYFQYYKSRYGAAESEASGWFTAACSPMIYHDNVLPGLRGQYFVCEPAGNLIHRAIIESDGPALKLRRAIGEEKSEFAASTDAWSHPMNLAHGPDGSIWIVDYYREIIEDYSAIPRHLQQQYGLYAGHDRGRIYRLTHKDAPRPASADMSRLNVEALAREIASPLFWRRQTAQRLILERKDKSASATLRELLAQKSAQSSTIITALRTLDGLNVLVPGDLTPFITHANAAARIHALQLADPSFGKDTSLLDCVLAAAASEQNPRVLIQFALSLGESRDARAVAMLARFDRDHRGIRWMDAAIRSSRPGSNETTATTPVASVTVPPTVPVSDETFRKFLAALAGPRDRKRGHEIFVQACASCHRIGNEGFEFAPDLLGQIGAGEEALLREILVPSERIRPGFETTLVELRDGNEVAGLLKNDGATSITLAQPNGVEQVLLRKNVRAVRQVPTSLMPSFMEGLSPQDVANLLAWLRSQAR